ncbi:MAG TPA: hypothetical protein EYQ83_21965, partial [Acidobacteria bacterium]|nr:hypothetical protein [Acidobacteriota bacterium]
RASSFAGVSTHPLVATLARHVRSGRPGIELELSSQNFALSAIQKLAKRETDIALGRWDVVPQGIGAQVVMTDSLVLAVPATHRLAGHAEVGFAELEGERFVSLPVHEGSVLIDVAFGRGMFEAEMAEGGDYDDSAFSAVQLAMS